MKAKVVIRGLEVELDGTSDEIAAVIRAAVATPAMPFVPYLQNPAIEYQLVYTGHVCEYPSPWNGVMPPSCKSCGVAAAVQTIVCGTDVSIG